MSKLKRLCNRSVKILYPTKSVDDYGTMEMTFATLSTQDMGVRQLSADESIAYGKESNVGFYRFYVDGSPDVREDYRLEWSNRTFHILGINQPGNRSPVILQIDGYELEG